MTKPTTIALVLALTGLGLAGCETADQKLIAAGKTPMSGPEIQRLLASATTRGTHETWTDFTIQHLPGGRMTINWTSGSNSGSDTGIWRVKGDKSCTKWGEILDGVERCWTIYKIRDNQYQSVREGSLGAMWSVIK